jgi:hypothetical protein
MSRDMEKSAMNPFCELPTEEERCDRSGGYWESFQRLQMISSSILFKGWKEKEIMDL